LKYVSRKDYKAVTTDLKLIYRSSTEEEALLEIERFSDTWDEQYPQISKSWRAQPKTTASQQLYGLLSLLTVYT
jgi:transposase-like protein